MGYVRSVYGARGGIGSQLDSTSIQNKITQTLTYLFVFMYSSDWTSFFRDIQALASTPGSSSKDHVPGILLYLRTLLSVHDEIADVMVSKSSEDQNRHRDLKDMVRQRDAADISSSWQEILAEWKMRDSSVTELCLRTIGRWVSWTDISLVVNDSVINVLFELLSTSDAVQDTSVTKKRDAAIETFTEIMGKKMNASDKLELVEVLKTRQVVSQLVDGPALRDLRSTSQYDIDLAENVAKLVNNTVYDIVKALDGAQDGDSVTQRGISQLHSFMPFILRFFSDEYDEVCVTVIPCLTDLLTLLRNKMKMNSRQYSDSLRELPPPILDAIIAKMRYDETSTWGNEDAQTDEAEFQDLRKKLYNLQRAVAAVDENLCLEKFSNVISLTFDNYQTQNGQLDWRDLDLALHEMYLFGELALKEGGLYSKTGPTSSAAERLIAMMLKMIESGSLHVYLIVLVLTFIRYRFLHSSSYPITIYGNLCALFRFF